jgi:hypothetical protein
MIATRLSIKPKKLFLIKPNGYHTAKNITKVMHCTLHAPYGKQYASWMRESESDTTYIHKHTAQHPAAQAQQLSSGFLSLFCSLLSFSLSLHCWRLADAFTSIASTQHCTADQHRVYGNKSKQRPLLPPAAGLPTSLSMSRCKHWFSINHTS